MSLRQPADAAPREVDDPSLVQGCRAADQASLDRFFRLHAPYVTRVLGRLVGPTADLEDLVQNTFLEAMRSFPNYRGEASLKTWITRIAVHVSTRQLRRGVRRNVLLSSLASEPQHTEASDSKDQALDARQLAAQVHRLLDRIGAKKRMAFLLYTVEGHSIEEVAALTGAGRAATKSRIWLARRELVALARAEPSLRSLLEQTAAGGSS